jgi:hypothetical protein
MACGSNSIVLAFELMIIFPHPSFIQRIT